MISLTVMSAIVGMAGAVTSFVSAYYWRKASDVPTVPTGIEPGTARASQAWQLSAVQEGLWIAAPFNAKAATCAAWAAGLFGVAGLLGAAAALF